MLATVILWLAAAYAAAGLIFALYFAAAGAARLDAGVRGGPLLFRLLLIPGAAALWPVMLSRTLKPRKETHP
jgi:hypothetical protein